MAETRQQDTPGAGEAGRERGGRGPQETARAGAAQMRQGAEAGAEAGQRGGQAAATAMRAASETGTEAMQRGGEAMDEMARSGTQTLAEGGRQIAEGAAHDMEESVERTAEAIRCMAHDISRLMMMPRTAGGGLQDMQDAMNQLMNGVMRTNLRITQEMFRRTNPGAVVELQGSFMREYLEAMVEGGATMLRATRRTADEALRPLEEQMERRNGETRQNRGAGQGQRGPRVAEVMTRDVRVVNPEDSVQQAARMMGEADAGAVPVGENDRLIGMITDHDLAVRVLAEGKDPARTKVRDVMTPGTAYVFEDEDLGAVAESMRGRQVRRMPVLNRDKRLVGIVSLGDLAREAGAWQGIGRALSGMSRERGKQGHATARR
jgi:CBS domain-containing protein